MFGNFESNISVTKTRTLENFVKHNVSIPAMAFKLQLKMLLKYRLRKEQINL